MFEAEDFLRSLTHRPGVYRMLDETGELIYVGKARDLKKRVTSYFRRAHDAKAHALLRHINDIEVTVTGTETEALLLEYNLIKSHKPRFNVVLRDDKSYPYIYLATDHPYPRLAFHRGSRKRVGRFFGPFPSAKAVRESLNQLQKLFLLRPCEDSFFANRSRPCLQYQIQRCSAPCVGLISEADYALDLTDAITFLEGNSEEVGDSLARRMEQAAGELDYEKAAHYRDQIGKLKRVQEKQFVTQNTSVSVDALGVAVSGSIYCVCVLFIRNGRILGSRNYFPRHALGADRAEVMTAFVSQYYLAREAPSEIVLRDALADDVLFQATFSERAGRKVRIKHRVRGERRRWLEMAETNADHGVKLRVSSNATVRRQLQELADILELDEPPQRIECFDVSHTGGESAVASCVVFGTEGAIKSDYRRFNIRGVTAGDDYGAMRQALERRYTRLKKSEARLPDLLLVDGGRGQLREASEMASELQLDGTEILAVAKGVGRKPGREKLFLAGRKGPLILPTDSSALHLIQQIRDEAHRFAITGHRQRRQQGRRVSVLESIPGLGPKRRRALLLHFGGLQGVVRAGVDDLAKVNGISVQLAESIYENFHSDA